MRREFNIPETEECRLFKAKEGFFAFSVPLSCLDVTIYEAGLARITGVSYNDNQTITNNNFGIDYEPVSDNINKKSRWQLAKTSILTYKSTKYNY